MTDHKVSGQAPFQRPPAPSPTSRSTRSRRGWWDRFGVPDDIAMSDFERRREEIIREIEADRAIRRFYAVLPWLLLVAVTVGGLLIW